MSEKLPDINWKKSHFIEQVGKARHYEAIGESENGMPYRGRWIEVEGYGFYGVDKIECIL